MKIQKVKVPLNNQAANKNFFKVNKKAFSCLVKFNFIRSLNFLNYKKNLNIKLRILFNPRQIKNSTSLDVNEIYLIQLNFFSQCT